MGEILLEARDVGFSWLKDGQWALSGCSLQIQRGKRLAVMGANGSGKSTLFLLLLGLLRPDRGSLFLGGYEYGWGRKDLVELRRRVGLVFQNPDDQLFGPTVFADVAVGVEEFSRDREEQMRLVNDVLVKMGVADLRDCSPHLLSFGQKKRVALAGALVRRPDVLIFDEPTAGLDPRGVMELERLLNRLVQENVTVVVASHDVDFLFGWADEAVVLSRGQIVTSGEAMSVFSQKDILSDVGLRQPLLWQIWAKLALAGPVPRSLALQE